MTANEYFTLERELIDNGYRKWCRQLSNEDYYYCKGFEYEEDEDGDRKCAYHVIFSVWDMRKYPQVPEKSFFGVCPIVMLHGNRYTELELHYGENIEIREIERIANSFYDWAIKNIES